VTGRVNFWDNADTSSASVFDNLADIGVAVDFASGVRVLGHFRVHPHLNGPRLGVGEVPVKDVEFRKRHSVELQPNLGYAEKVAGGVKHDAADWVQRRVLDCDGLLDDQASMAISDDNLLEGCEGVHGTPDSLGRDVDAA
jgi:hypothetical protein